MKIKLSVGQFSDAGVKAINQDALAYQTHLGNEQSLKGHMCVMADGISSSQVSQEASQSAVSECINTYYLAPETWATEKAIDYTLKTINGALLKRTHLSPFKYDKNKGYVCTLAGIVFKGQYAHLFHLGDTRIHRIGENGFETLTNDHRVWVTQHQSHLSRALGVTEELQPEHQTLRLKKGDIYLISTDGIHEFLTPDEILSTVLKHRASLKMAAHCLGEMALKARSDDNVSVMLISVDDLITQTNDDQGLHNQLGDLPFAPDLKEGDTFEGYRLLTQLHASARSHVFLALDESHQQKVILKLPSTDLRDNPSNIDQFMLEEWIAQRLDSPYLLKPYSKGRPRESIYSVMEYIEGQTLKQWLLDHPHPSVEEVREIIEQVGKGLQAMHRRDLLHQDIKPDNIMISPDGQVKIIDFGSTRVAGLTEADLGAHSSALLGTALYSAPEYFLGDGGTERSDQYALAVLTYHMLSGRFPYGVNVAKARTLSLQRRLTYQSVLDQEREIPLWLDETLKRALSINPQKRYIDISEFLYDLRHPNKAYLKKTRPPLLERQPIRVWQSICAVQFLFILYLISLLTH
jgi:serine/threonine protein phosphatase PrpC